MIVFVEYDSSSWFQDTVEFSYCNLWVDCVDKCLNFLHAIKGVVFETIKVVIIHLLHSDCRL